MGPLFIFSVAVLFGAILSCVAADPIGDKEALLHFLQNMGHTRPLNWNRNSSVCKTWTGVTCNNDQSRILAVHLPGIGLHGPIPPHTLGRLSAIQNLSLRLNSISGPFPSDLSKLKNLTNLYLQYNQFSGPLPSDFSVWENLNVINLSNNALSGSIPSSVSNLTHLTYLNLANNTFSGEIPDLNIPSLQRINLANNNLTGFVPKSLQRFPSWAFVGNNFTSENAFAPDLPIQPSKKTSKLSEPALLGIIIGGCVLGFVVIAAIMIVCCLNKGGENGLPVKSLKKEVPLRKAASKRQDRNNRLVFFEGCNLAFDLEDLLRASAEVLGKGTFGTTYKAALEDPTTVAVKRLKEVTVGKREFEQQMELVGRIRHDNVAALRAYYYSKDEKLTVHDYYDQGSISVRLHGNRGEDRIPLDWDTRLRIAIGAARGIAHIHTQHGGKLVHGNIKASNIFLNSQGYGCVSDIGLATLMSPIPPPALRTAGYRAPEVNDSRKAAHASDVYGFGVLLLELLTGKSPIHTVGSEEVVHLVRWVNSVVREEWTAEVFDIELLRYPNIEEEMVEMLQIGMACVVRMPDQRPKMPDVVRMVEEIRRVNTENRQSSGSKSEVSTPTPHATEIGSSSVLQ
ncbi:Mitogen-activated protein kinase kinase kinase [Quillaja saponaria]|uniref:Mitogen-activated protein kinase kinase kinase n=1 Tax=Quillaja saponaria TaxID=32244 RepID=A0AAD7LWA2_QUISA|nr:Mitogen-activated protein kinase kinase kinase [Quillaja saponaria]